MQAMIWIGAAITLAGVGGLLFTAWTANALRKTGRDDAELRAALQKTVNRNLIALGVSVLGLMTVIIGLAFR